MNAKLLIADDHQVVLDGLTALIKHQRDLKVIGTAKNGREVLEFLQASPKEVDMLLMDITMPELDGLDTMVYIQEHYPNLKVIILSMHLSAAYAKKLIALGARGYLQKDCDKQELLEAIKEVHEGGFYLSKSITHVLVSDRFDAGAKGKELTLPKLSKRETQILRLILEEHPTRSIATVLGISFNTVETHRKHLLNKFGVKTTVGLVKEALRGGFV